MADEKDYTTVRIERSTKYDIEQISVQHWRETGEKKDAAGIIKMMVEFFTSFKKEPKEKEGGK